MPQVLSANRLADGIVVFLDAAGQWVESIAGAEVFADKAALEAGVARATRSAAANLVVEVAPVDVALTPRGPQPTHIRDRIRAAGPTVYLDHGKQAAGL
jgi:Protein of unknown function (DUF2849)